MLASSHPLLLQQLFGLAGAPNVSGGGGGGGVALQPTVSAPRPADGDAFDITLSPSGGSQLAQQLLGAGLELVPSAPGVGNGDVAAAAGASGGGGGGAAAAAPPRMGLVPQPPGGPGSRSFRARTLAAEEASISSHPSHDSECEVLSAARQGSAR